MDDVGAAPLRETADKSLMVVLMVLVAGMVVGFMLNGSSCVVDRDASGD